MKRLHIFNPIYGSLVNLVALILTYILAELSIWPHLVMKLDGTGYRVGKRHWP